MYASARPSPDDIDIRALAAAVWARRNAILSLAIVAGAATFIALSFVTPRYTSEARVLINNEETSFTRPATDTQLDAGASRPDPETVASQVQVLLSRDLAQRVVEKLKLDEVPEFAAPSGLLSGLRMTLRNIGLLPAPSEERLRQRVLDNLFARLSVYQVASSRVIAIRFTSTDPERASAVANALAQEYLLWQQQEKLRQTRDASQWLNRQIAELRRKVQESDARVEEFRNKSGLFIAGQNNVTLDSQQLSELNSQLILAKAQRTEAEARARQIEEMLRKQGDVEAAPDVLRSELIQRLLEQKVQVQRQLAELSATRLPSHPRIRQLQSELADLRRQIREEAAKVVKSLRNEAEIAGAREASLRNSLNELKALSAEANENQVKLRALEREAKVNRELLESYLARYGDASARRDPSSVPADATIISRAYAASTPSFPKKIPLTLLAMAATGLLSLAVILARALIQAQSAQAGAAHAVMPGRAAEPVLRRSMPAPRPSEAGTAEPGPAIERYAATDQDLPQLVQRLLAKARRNDRGRFAILGDRLGSDAVAEAIEVARGLAAGGRRVALVDMGGGGRGIAGALGLNRSPGMGELLEGRARFEDVVQLDPRSAVQVIAAGAVREHGSAGNVGLERVLTALDQAYDCVLVHADAPASLVGTRADGWAAAIVVCEEGKPASGTAATLAGELGLDTVRLDRRPHPLAERIPRFPFSRSAAATI